MADQTDRVTFVSVRFDSELEWLQYPSYCKGFYCIHYYLYLVRQEDARSATGRPKPSTDVTCTCTSIPFPSMYQ